MKLSRKNFTKIFSFKISWNYYLLLENKYLLFYSWVSPSKANVFRSFEVILNYVLDLVLLSMKYHSLDVVGIVLLIFAVIATGFEEEVKFRVKSTTDALTTARNYSPNSINRIYLAILSKIWPYKKHFFFDMYIVNYLTQVFFRQYFFGKKSMK